LFNEGDTEQFLTDKPLASGFQSELEFRNVGIWEERTPKEPSKNLLEQEQDPRTNSTNMCDKLPVLNLGYAGSGKWEHSTLSQSQTYQNIHHFV